MNNSSHLFFKLLLLFLAICLFASCIKNKNYIEGDVKIKFYNTVIGSKAQIFYINNGGLASDNGVSYIDNSGIAYGGNSLYLIAPGKRSITIYAKDVGATNPHTSSELALGIGENYSVFYTKKSSTDSSLFIYKDDLTLDTSKSKLLFVNMGYTLKSKVIIRDSLNSFTKTLGYGEKSDYVYLKFAGKNKLYFNLVDSAGVVDTLKAANFYKGKVYTILLDGSSIGKLKERLISNN